MKNLIILFVFFVTTLSFSQDHQIKVKGLVTAGQFANMAMEEVNFQLVLSNSSGRGGGTPVMHYDVVKRQDGNSGRLENAVRTGRVFNEVQVWVKSGGRTVKHKLTNAIFSDYSASFKKGKPATESFVIRFQNRTSI